MPTPIWFPRTKLIPPQVGRDLLPRPQLIERLYTAVLNHRLTLLSAPAGSGKTTAAATLHDIYSDIPLAWMTLDTDDNDPLTFLALFVAALQSCLPNCGQEVAALLGGQTAVTIPPRRLMAMLINDLLSAPKAHSIVVLDDLHHVTETAVLDILDYLLENLPPNLHLIATTRFDPALGLARLRARGQLADFRLPDLRFNDNEISRYLNEQWDLALPKAELAALAKQTEGWIASLHLLAGRLHELTDEAKRAEFIGRFTQSNRLIFDLLAEEVLAQQSPELRQFLLQTSILGELTADLCTAITQNPTAPQLLEQAYRRNLFLVALEEATAHQTAYRYHALFAGFLRRHLAQSDNNVAELHRRAASQSPPDHAVSHYLSAELWQDAAALLAEIGQGEVGRFLVSRHTVERILALPPELVEKWPWLQLTIGTYYAVRGQADASEPYLQRARHLFRAQGDEAGELEAITMEVARVGGQISPPILAALDEKFAQLPHLFRPAQATLLHMAHLWQMRSWADMSHHLHASMAVAQRDWDMATVMVVASAFGPEMLFHDEGLATSDQFFSEALRRTPPAHVEQRHLLGAALAYIRFYQARLDEAELLIRPVDHYLDQIGGMAWVDGHIFWLRLTLLLARQDDAGVARLLPLFRERIQQNSINFMFLPGLIYMQAHAAWQHGRLADMQAHIQQLAEAGDGYLGHSADLPLNLLHGRLALAQKNYRQAESLLQQAITAHHDVRHTVFLHEPRLALALLYHQWGREAEALAQLQAVLSELRQRGLAGVVLQEGPPLVPLLQLAVARGMMVEFIRPLLTILTADNSTLAIPIPHSSESLSPREIEVLQLVATGATNRAIAEQLVITERTVKAHVSSILQKLGTVTRTEAVSQARAWRLLP